MQVQLETLGALERRLNITLPMADIDAQVAQRLQRVARTAKVQGFRPGKAPLKIVEQNYGAQVREDVLGEEVQKSFAKAIQEQKIDIAGYPRFEPFDNQTATGESFTFSAVFEVYPEVAVGDLSGQEIAKATCDVTEAEIDKTIDILRKQRRSFAQRALDAAAQDGDRVAVDFEGKIDGEPFEGGKAEGFQFLVGEGQMLKEFEDAVRGMKAGESKTFPLAFPADYHGKDVAGKTADFLVTVKKIEAAHLPEVNDALAKSLGIADGSVEGLRADIKKNLEREVKFRLLARNKQAVMDALVAKAELDLPNASVQAEIARLMEGARAELKQRGIKDADKAEIPEDVFRPQAERRVRLGLVVAELVRANELQAKPEQLKAHIDELAASYEKPEDVVRWYFGDRQRLAEVEAVVIENNVTEFVLSKAKVVEKAVSFDELMGQG